MVLRSHRSRQPAQLYEFRDCDGVERGRVRPRRGSTSSTQNSSGTRGPQRALRTTTKNNTVNQALAEATALAARRRDLERLIEGRLADLGDDELIVRTRQRWRATSRTRARWPASIARIASIARMTRAAPDVAAILAP